MGTTARGFVASLAVSACLSSIAAALAGCGGSAGVVVAGDGAGGFGRYGKNAGELFEPNGISVDHRSGDIYVTDSNNVRIDKFTSDGTFQFAWGWGIADGKSLVPQKCSDKCFLGVEGPGLGQFQFPEGVAVDNGPASPSRGDLYVADIGNHRIQKFSPNGRFLFELGNGVNDVAHQQGYPAYEDRCPLVTPPVTWGICGPGSEFPSKGPADDQLEFSVEGNFIAVGSDGTLYVGQRNDVKEFTPQGAFKTQIRLLPPAPPEKGKESGGVSALTVDSHGDVYVVRHGVRGVGEYGPEGKLLRTLEGDMTPATPEGPTPALAVDTHDNLYVDVFIEDKTHRIDVFDPSGTKVASFDQGKADGLHGLAYNPKNNKLYIVNTTTNGTNATHIRAVTPPPATG